MKLVAGTVLLTLLALPPVFGQAQKKASDRQPPEKKGPGEVTLADFAGTWKNDTMLVNGRLFEGVKLTIQPDGKARATYKEKRGADFTLGFTELRIKQVRIKNKGTKGVTTITSIDRFLGVQWLLQLQPPNKLKALAITPTEKGPKVEVLAFTREPEKKK
jgi:hypothetical protein